MTAPTAESPKKTSYDPDEFRMTVGEHLEELRKRLLIGLAGFVVAGLVCLPMGKWFLGFICKPLMSALQAYDVNPQLVINDATEGFMAWLQISLIAAAAVAGPWMLYQLWQFVATGLYAHERKYITKFIPLSIVLLLSGFTFVYLAVLPLTMRFFVAFTISVPLELPTNNPLPPPPPGSIAATQPSYVQAIAEDPPKPGMYQMWFNTTERRLKVNAGGSIRILPFGSDSLMATQLKLGDYLDLVLRLLLTFGLCFQLPLVVLALARLGIMEIEQLTSMRRYVYFGMTVLAAAVSPGDVVTATIALLVPLILLYELGIFLARMGPKGEPI